MLLLALAIVPLLVLPLVFELSAAVERTLFTIDWIIWAAFAVEYGVRLYLAPRKREFVSHNIIDLVAVLIPFLRPLRVARSARALRLLRAARGAVFLLRAIDAAQDVLRKTSSATRSWWPSSSWSDQDCWSLSWNARTQAPISSRFRTACGGQ